MPVIIAPSHLRHRLDVADVLGDQHQHDGDEHRQDREVDLRKMEFREADPRRVADGRKVDLTAEACIHIADDHTEQDVQTSDKTAEQHGDEQHGEQRHQGGVPALLPVRPHAGSQVEADDRDDGAVDDRRHDDVNPLRAGEVDGHAHQGEQQACDHDAEAGGRNALARGGDGGDRGDEPERRPQVARQHVLVDEQEQRGRHRGEEQRRRRVEMRQDRHQERRAEHGDDVLGADADGTGPGQSLIGLHDLAGRERLAVAMQFPCEQVSHHELLRFSQVAHPCSHVPR